MPKQLIIASKGTKGVINMDDKWLSDIKEYFKAQTGKVAKVVSRIGFNRFVIETEENECYTVTWTKTVTHTLTIV